MSAAALPPEPPGMRHRQVRVRDVELHVAEAGEGPPLLLLHGWPQHWWMWRKLIPALAEGHRVIAPDMRGFGRSEAPPGLYRKHELAEDVVALLDNEEIEKATIVGHDWGGWTAWLLALEHAERVARFASLDIPPPWVEDRSPVRIAGFLAFATYQYVLSTPVLGERLLRTSPAFIRRFIPAGSSRRAEWNEEELDAYATVLQEPDRARASSALYRTFLTREVPALLRGTYTSRALRVPGLVVMGGSGAIAKLIGVPERRPNLEVEVIEGAGHFLPEEAPDEVLELLLPFLAAAGGERATATATGAYS